MFEALDTIDWSNVSSCYGWSKEIPIAIRGLVSEETTVRDEALGTLWLSLLHQESVFEASPLAVPFLLEILADPSTQDKRQLVHFLAHLGSRDRSLGESYQTLKDRLTCQHVNAVNGFLSQEVRDRHRGWEEETHQGFREGHPIFLSLLSDPDPTIRQEIAFLLATFPEDHSRLLPPLITQLQVEKDEYVQCSLLLYLGHLLAPLPETTQLLLHYLENGETELLQLATAGALCTILKEQTPEKVVHVFFEAFTHPRPSGPSYEPFCSLWRIELIHANDFYYLDQLMSSPHQALIMERFVGIYPSLGEGFDEDCADLLLRIAFYEKGFPVTPRRYGVVEPSLSFTFDDLDPIKNKTSETGCHLYMQMTPMRYTAIDKMLLPSVYTEVDRVL